MPAIHLVRHGQASFGAGDYDRLSPLGHEQARAVGAALRARGVAPALVVHGSLRRQRETAQAIAAAWADGPPPLREDAGWDEYDHQQLLTALAADPAFAARTGDGVRAAGDAVPAAAAGVPAPVEARPTPARAFQAALEEALARWASGAHDAEYAEPFAAFRARADAALDAVVTGAAGTTADVVGAAGGSGGAAVIAARTGTTVVVSSAGTIGAVVATLLRVDAEAWAALNRVAVNTGVTTLAVGRGGRSLVTFNDHGHLGGAGRPERTTR